MKMWLWVFVLGVGVATAADGDALSRQLDAFEAQHDRFPGEPASAADGFGALERYVAAADELGEVDLARLFDAAYVAVFYTHDAAVADTAGRLLDALERRGIATDAQRANLHKAWVTTRRFEEANALAQRHPQLSRAPIPTVDDQRSADAALPTALFVTPDAGLVRRTVRLDAAAEVLVVASSGCCGFSVRALAAIETDPQLRGVFEHHARWVQPPQGYLDVAELHEWNQKHPLAPLMLAWSVAEWAPFDLQRMPIFYFLRDGEIVDSVVGWTGAESQAAVANRLSVIGLLD